MMSENAKVSLLIAVLSVLSVAVSMLFSSTALANAAGSTFVTITDQTETDETDFKSLTVTCPQGMKAISGGAGIFYSRSEGNYVLPLLISSFMYPDDASWFAEGVQPEAANTDWYLQVQVTCVEAAK
jgi:hypothetical protein